MWSPLRNERADWIIALEALYEREMTAGQVEDFEHNESVANRGRDNTAKRFQIRNDTRLASENVQDALDQLLATGLLGEEEIRGHRSFGLTQDGFQMAHRIKIERQRQRTNQLLLVLTGILVALTVVLVVLTLGPLL